MAHRLRLWPLSLCSSRLPSSVSSVSISVLNCASCAFFLRAATPSLSDGFVNLFFKGWRRTWL